MTRVLLAAISLFLAIGGLGQVRPKPAPAQDTKPAEASGRYEIATIDLAWDEFFKMHTVAIRLDTFTGKTDIQGYIPKTSKPAWKPLTADGLPLTSYGSSRFRIYPVSGEKVVVRAILLDRLSGLTWALMAGENWFDLPTKWEPFAVEP